MSLSTVQKPLKLNIINKQSPSLKISLIAGNTLTISHLKRKIETQFSQLYGLQIVIKLIEDSNGFIISNNSNVDEHFKNGDTIYFSCHGEEEKNGVGMKMVSNFGEILATIRFMTASALEKLDRIDLGKLNVMEVVADLLHIGFWYANTLVVQKLYKIFNKIFGQASIQTFLSTCPQLQMQLFLKNFTFWLCDTTSPLQQIPQISWQLLQLLEKLTLNQKFIQIIKSNKLCKTILEMSKDSTASNEVKKICVRIVRNVNGGGGRGVGSGLQKMRSEYMPSMLMNSNVSGQNVQDILQMLSSSSQDQKLSALQHLTQNSCYLLSQSTIRTDYYQKLTNIFTIQKTKTKKHLSLLLQCIKYMIQNITKDQCIEIIQKDILKKIHLFMLSGGVEVHGVALEYLGKICRVSSLVGGFNVERALELLKSPYQEVVKIIAQSLVTMSQKLPSISPIRFLPSIRDYITLSLKSQSEPLTLCFLKLTSNLTLDEQCRYQIINLKGIEVFVKFLQTSKNHQICRVCAKGLLNLAISGRENKVKVLGAMTNVIQRYYRGEYEGVTAGYVDTILKAKNM